MSEPDEGYWEWMQIRANADEAMIAENDRLTSELESADKLVDELFGQIEELEARLARLTHGGRPVDTVRNDEWLALWRVEQANNGSGAHRRSKAQMLERVIQQWCEVKREGRSPHRPDRKTVDRGIHEATRRSGLGTMPF